MKTNLFKRAVFYCLNHDEPVPLVVMEGNTPFYACPKFMLADGLHPNGHAVDESPCHNRISLTMMGNIFQKVSKIMNDEYASGNMMDFTGMTFLYNMIQVKILKNDSDSICIGVSNRRITG